MVRIQNWRKTMLPVIALIEVATVVIPLLQKLMAAGSNQDMISLIKTLGPVVGTLAQIGGQMFPGVAAALQPAAAATTFDPVYVKWVQESCNALLVPNPNLKVDGVYGEGTKAAVKLLQRELHVTEDGWVGKVTKKLIEEKRGVTLVPVAPINEENKGMFSNLKISVFGSWKTSFAGLALILGAVADVVTQLSTGALDLNRLWADVTGIITGVGLLFAKDGNVTGGNVKN